MIHCYLMEIHQKEEDYVKGFIRQSHCRIIKKSEYDTKGVGNAYRSNRNGYYISGDREPKPEVLANIATALQVTSDYLLGTEQEGDIDSDYPKIVRLIARNAAAMTAEQKRNIITALLEE